MFFCFLETRITLRYARSKPGSPQLLVQVSFLVRRLLKTFMKNGSTNFSKTRLGCGPYILNFGDKITIIYCVLVGRGHMAVERAIMNSFSRAKFRISEILLFMNQILNFAQEKQIVTNVSTSMWPRPTRTQ